MLRTNSWPISILHQSVKLSTMGRLGTLERALLGAVLAALGMFAVQALVR